MRCMVATHRLRGVVFTLTLVAYEFRVLTSISNHNMHLQKQAAGVSRSLQR